MRDNKLQTITKIQHNMKPVTLRFTHKESNSTPPTRITGEITKEMMREGMIKLSFQYEGTSYQYQLPFMKPYINKSEGKLAGLLNINASRKQAGFNPDFRLLEQRLTVDFTRRIEIPALLEVI